MERSYRKNDRLSTLKTCYLIAEKQRANYLDLLFLLLFTPVSKIKHKDTKTQRVEVKSLCLPAS
jgi:hypothetical protein